jgi:hypothetical protein
MRTLAWLGFLVMVTCAASDARAAPARRGTPAPRVAVTSATLFLQGGSAPEADDVYARLEQGLRRAGLAVVTARRVRLVLASKPDLQGCETPACRRRVGRLLKVGYGVQIKARGDAARTHLEVVVSRTRDGAQAFRMKRRCARCGEQALLQAVAALAAKAARRLRRVHREASGVGRPARPGARRAGSDSGEGAGSDSGSGAGSGPHSGGPDTGSGTGSGASSGAGSGGPDVGAGAGARVGAGSGGAQADALTAWDRKKRQLWITGAVVAGAGVAALATGATLWALDGTLYRSLAHTDRVYDTQTGGITGTALGLAGLAAGAGLILYALLRQPPRPSAARAPARPRGVTVRVSAGGLWLSGRF